MILGRLTAPATLKVLFCGQSQFLPPIGPKGHLQSRHKSYQVVRSPRLKKFNFEGKTGQEKTLEIFQEQIRQCCVVITQNCRTRRLPCSACTMAMQTWLTCDPCLGVSDLMSPFFQYFKQQGKYELASTVDFRSASLRFYPKTVATMRQPELIPINSLKIERLFH